MAGPYLTSGATTAIAEANLKTLSQGVFWTQQYETVYNEGQALKTQSTPYAIGAIIVIAIPIILGYYVTAAAVVLAFAIIVNRSDLLAKWRQNAIAEAVEGAVLQQIATDVRQYLDTKKKDVENIKGNAELAEWQRKNNVFVNGCDNMIKQNNVPLTRDLRGQVVYRGYFGAVITTAMEILSNFKCPPKSDA